MLVCFGNRKYLQGYRNRENVAACKTLRGKRASLYYKLPSAEDAAVPLLIRIGTWDRGVSYRIANGSLIVIPLSKPAFPE